MTTPIQLSPDSPHIPALLSLIQRAFAYMEARIDPPSSMHRLTEVSLRAQCGRGEIWIIGDPPVACVTLTDKGDHLYLGKLAVDASARGNGYARTLVDLAVTRAQFLGHSEIVLETRIELTENHATFAHMGFDKTREGAHDGYDRPTYIEMRKAL